MSFAWQRLSPNQSRTLYDVAASAACAVAAIAYCSLLLGRPPTYPLVAAPVLILAFNRLLGIYTRFRIGEGRTKAVVLTASVVLSALALAPLVADRAALVLWAGLVWGPLVLPRVFLNLNVRVKSPIVAAIQERGPVLVVGGGGYIGTHVVEQLLASGRCVRVLDKLMFGREPLQDFLANPRFQLVGGDATEIVQLVTAMNGASAVVHLAGLVGDPACAVDEVFTRHANVIATRMVKEVALSLSIPRLVFASSCSVYGYNENEVHEESELNPVSLYARTKIDSERELLLCPNENFYVTILRFATVFGHSRRPRFDLVANLFSAQAMKDGRITVIGPDQWRPFIHVRDLARAVVAVLDAPPHVVRSQIYNVGDRRLNMTIGQLAERVKNVVAKERPVEVTVNPGRSEDLRNYRVSFEKISRELGFEAKTLLEEGIEEIVAAHRNGAYGHYREALYSNVEMTKRALSAFNDPDQNSKLYGPLGVTPGPAPRPATPAVKVEVERERV